MYSTQAAVQTLLINVLCRKLAAVPNPGNEQAQLEAIKATLQQQGIALADITDKMVADLATGYCNKVVAALTNLPKGADDVQPVADLDKIINNDLVNQLVSDALSNELTQCPIETPPALQQEMALAGGRIAAYTIDPNRLFIAPDGRAVKLPDGATPKFFNFSGSWGTPPAGTLQGFVLADGSLYFAHIINSPQKFEGYALVKSPFCPAIYKEDIYVTTAATTPTAVYYFDFYSSNDQCGYRWNEGAYTLKPTADHSLIDIQPVFWGPLPMPPCCRAEVRSG